MKAIIKIVTARREFRQDQIAILRRIAMVLQEHDLSVDIRINKKVTKEIKLSKLKAV